MNQQAVLWKTDCDKFNDFSNNRDNEKAGIMSEYKSNLQEQINYRKNAEKKWKCGMLFQNFNNVRHESKRTNDEQRIIGKN